MRKGRRKDSEGPGPGWGHGETHRRTRRYFACLPASLTRRRTALLRPGRPRRRRLRTRPVRRRPCGHAGSRLKPSSCVPLMSVFTEHMRHWPFLAPGRSRSVRHNLERDVVRCRSDTWLPIGPGHQNPGVTHRNTSSTTTTVLRGLLRVFMGVSHWQGQHRGISRAVYQLLDPPHPLTVLDGATARPEQQLSARARPASLGAHRGGGPVVEFHAASARAVPALEWIRPVLSAPDLSQPATIRQFPMLN